MKTAREVIRTGLHGAFSMLAPSHMAHAREYVLNVDMAVDIASLSCNNSLSNVATLDVQRAVLSDEALTIDMKMLIVPSVNVAGHCCGIAVVDTCESPPPGSDAAVKRWSSVGRYIRREATGEILFVTTSLKKDGSPALDGSIRIVWAGEPLGKDRRKTTTAVIECDATLFNSGRILESVKACEVGPRQVTSRCTMCSFPGDAAPAAGAAPTRLCEAHLTLRQPANMMDFTNNLHNMRAQEGLMVGGLMRVAGGAHGVVAENIMSFLTVRVGKDELLIARLLKVASEAHAASVRHVVSGGSAEEGGDGESHHVFPLAARSSVEKDPGALLEPYPELTDVDLFGCITGPPREVADLKQPDSFATSNTQAQQFPPCKPGQELAQASETTDASLRVNPTGPPLSAHEPFYFAVPPPSAVTPELGSPPEALIETQRQSRRRGGKPLLSREEAEYRKVMSNRASAARSNARRRKAFQSLTETLATAKAQLHELQRRKQRLLDQNLYMKHLIASSGLLLPATG